MFNIADKKLLIDTIQAEIRCYYPYMDKDYDNGPIGQVINDRIERMVRSAVHDMACKTAEILVKHLYTHQEFEKDIGLIK
jgi:uncharacterized protein YqeY